MTSIKMKIIYCVLFALSFFTISCNHKDDNHGLGADLCTTANLKLNDSSDYLAFGVMYQQMKFGRFFQLRNGHLYDANMMTYNGPFIFYTGILPEPKYQVALPLFTSFPDEARCKPDSAWGSSDMINPGEFVVEYKSGNTLRRWTFGRDTTTMPVSVRPYSLQLSAVINQLL